MIRSPRAIQEAAVEANRDTMFLIRVTHSSGLLEGHYTAQTQFPPNDHRNHRPRGWLLNGVRKIEQLRFFESSDRTLGQAALQWLLQDTRAASTDTPVLSDDELDRIQSLFAINFGIQEEAPKFKGTMEIASSQ